LAWVLLALPVLINLAVKVMKSRRMILSHREKPDHHELMLAMPELDLHHASGALAMLEHLVVQDVFVAMKQAATLSCEELAKVGARPVT